MPLFLLIVRQKDVIMTKIDKNGDCLMSEISDDPRCKKIDQELDDYAEKVRWWTIKKSWYERNGYGNKFQYAEEYPHPDDNKATQKDIKDEIDNKIDAYVRSFEGEKRALANSHFLWKFTDYFSYPIADYVIGLEVKAITERPLPDKEKIKFLQYLFGNKYTEGGRKSKQLFHRFNEDVILKLLDFNPNNNLREVDDLYEKVSAFFDKQKRKNDKKIKLLYKMFNVFIKNARKIAPEAVVNYAEIYFNMAERTTENLDAGILLRLAQKTPYALKHAEICGEAEILDKKTIKEIFRAYVNHVNQQKDFNQNLGASMANLGFYLFSQCGYTIKEAKDLINILYPKEKDENGAMIRDNQKRKSLRSIANKLEQLVDDNKRMNNSLIKDIDKENPEISDERIVNYAQAMFEYVAKSQNNTANLNTLFNMLTKGGKVNNDLLLEVVDVYGQSVKSEDINKDRHNQIMHNKMTKMLQGIVTEYDYTPEEMKVLKRHIEQGANGHEEFAEMGRVVENTWAQKGDWRYEQAKKNVIPAIIHKKGGKSL